MPELEQHLFTDPSVRSFIDRVASVRYFVPLDHERIAGWLSPRERQVLFALGRWAPGPILEVGPWAGLSTTAIAQGIRQSREHKEFVSVELNPTTRDFREWEGSIGFFPGGADSPRGSASREL